MFNLKVKFITISIAKVKYMNIDFDIYKNFFMVYYHKKHGKNYNINIKVIMRK
jgi:hypothetical protein